VSGLSGRRDLLAPPGETPLNAIARLSACEIMPSDVHPSAPSRCKKIAQSM
jgi:hypothetical protein